MEAATILGRNTPKIEAGAPSGDGDMDVKKKAIPVMMIKPKMLLLTGMED